MPQTVKGVMTANPVTLPADATAADAAKKMRDEDIGPIVVVDGNEVTGIVTDRDIIVRVIAEGKDPAQTPLRNVSSEKVQTVEPDSSIGDVISLMEKKAIRRIPVVEGGRPVGIVSLGDLAAERDLKSALGKISKAPPNN